MSYYKFLLNEVNELSIYADWLLIEGATVEYSNQLEIIRKLNLTLECIQNDQHNTQQGATGICPNCKQPFYPV